MGWKPIQVYRESRFARRDGNNSDRTLFDGWAKGKDIVRWTDGPNDLIDLPKFLRTGRRVYVRGYGRQEMPPRVDHAVTFKSRMGKCWMTYQPYVRAQDMRPLVRAWALHQGLKATVYDEDRSWYYPGATCLVVIEVPDDEG